MSESHHLCMFSSAWEIVWYCSIRGLVQTSDSADQTEYSAMLSDWVAPRGSTLEFLWELFIAECVSSHDTRQFSPVLHPWSETWLIASCQVLILSSASPNGLRLALKHIASLSLHTWGRQIQWFNMRSNLLFA